jgi:glycosyltransferase involved in cell wall biosynthesis
MNAAARRVKICYVIDNLAFRGGERVFAQLATHIDCSRYEVIVACSPGGPFVERLEAAGVPVVAVNMRPQFNPIAVAQLAAFLRRWRPDIVHCQGRGDPYGRIAARLAGAPIVISTAAAIVSRYWVNSRWRKLMYRAIDRATDPLVDHWIVLNQRSVEVLQEDHKVALQRISIIPNGIEVECFRPETTDGGKLRRELGLGPEAQLIGAVGRLVWEKGFDTLIAAMPAILKEHPQAHLVIAGDGELGPALRSQAEQLGIASRCHLLGYRSDVPDVLAALDLFVLSSLVEGMPMVLLEAMASGKPVVATRIPGTMGLVEDEVSGALVQEQDPHALGIAVIGLLGDKKRARDVAARGQRMVLERNTVEAMVERTCDLYGTISSNVASIHSSQ